MITPELKDKVLNNLLSHNDVTYTFNIIQLANELNCSSDTIRAILDYFNRLNLISATNYTIGGRCYNFSQRRSKRYGSPRRVCSPRGAYKKEF